MSNQENLVLIKLSYDSQILVSVDDLSTLMKILQGSPLVTYGYANDVRYEYLKDEAYCLEIGNAAPEGYITQENFEALEASLGVSTCQLG